MCKIHSHKKIKNPRLDGIFESDTHTQTNSFIIRDYKMINNFGFQFFTIFYIQAPEQFQPTKTTQQNTIGGSTVVIDSDDEEDDVVAINPQSQNNELPYHSPMVCHSKNLFVCLLYTSPSPRDS